MKERLDVFLAKVREVTKNLSSKTKKIIILGVAISLIASIGIALWLNNKPYVTLFSDLTNEEASEIMGKLQEQGVDYKYETDGTILVPQEQEEQLKAQLVYEGYPKSGFTYDHLANIDLTTSESEKQQLELMDLQDRMGATVSLFPNVKDAKVTIALGEDRRYVLDNNNATQATASVTVITDNGDQLDEDAIRAIQRLVSKSIPDLEFSNVAVICNGQDVTVSEERSQVDANDLKFQMEQIIDNKIRDKVLAVLVPIYGEGHVEVSVNSEVDINKKIREIINYSPENPETNTGVISSQTATQEISSDGETVGGVPGTETNADIPIYTRIETDGTENYVLSDGSAEYLVDQVKEQEQVDAGDLTDLSVAVIIDGEDVGDLTEANLRSLIAKAAGISVDDQDAKIEIVSVPFYSETTETVPDDEPLMQPEQLRQVMLWVAIAGGALLILLIVLMVLLRRRKKKRLAFEEAMARQNSAPIAQPRPVTPIPDEAKQQVDNLDMVADLLDIKNERSLELKNKIREITDENPEISAQTLKTWLRGGKING